MKKKYVLMMCILLLSAFAVFPAFSQIKGDANKDGSVDIVDALIIAQHYVGLLPTILEVYYADVNCDGNIDIIDALLVAQYCVGLIPLFDCEEPTNPPLATQASTNPPISTPTPEPDGTPTPTIVPEVTPNPDPTETPDPTEVPGELSIIPGNIDFESVLPGEMVVKSLIMENNTNETVNVSDISIAPANVFGWGENYYGQLGVVIPTGNYTAIPQANGLENVVRVETFYSSTFYVTEDGSLWASGYNNYGQLGDGTHERKVNPVLIMEGGVQKVSAGMSHTLILKTDGSVWGCGSTSKGQLGLGNLTADITTPTEIISSGVIDIAAGGAFGFILKADNTLWGFGVNAHGQLGTNDMVNVSTPVMVMEDVITIAAGYNHSLAIKEGGSLWTCGQNSSGELGNGTYNDSSVFTQVMENSVLDVKGGSDFSLIRLVSNVLLGCGSNELGQLGNDYYAETATLYSIDFNVIDMDAGALHTLYIKDDGSLWGCGSNGLYQLADESGQDKYAPFMIADSGVIAACGGFAHSVIVRTPTELVYSLANNNPVSIESGQSSTIDVILDTELQGKFGGVITIESDLLNKPVINIPVWGIVSE